MIESVTLKVDNDNEEHSQVSVDIGFTDIGKLVAIVTTDEAGHIIRVNFTEIDLRDNE